MTGTCNWFEKMAFLAAHPVGSYFWSSNATSPQNRYGGEWAQIKDRFVLAVGDSYSVGSTGGEARHTLTIDEIPAHRHTVAFEQVSEGVYTATAWEIKGSGFYAPNTTNLRAAETSATGSGMSHNNMPPYIAAYCWQRTA